MALSFLTEATNGFEDTETIGRFGHSSHKNTFDQMFESTASDFMARGVDVKMDLSQMIHNPTYMGEFKNSVLQPLQEAAETEPTEAYGHARACYEAVNTMWDNCVADFVKESQSVTSLLPIKTLDLPILVKQHIKAAAKDIVQTEVAKSPIIRKHIERSYVVDNKTGKRWEYPRCFFDGTYSEFFEAGSGVKIEFSEPFTMPQYELDIIDKLATENASNPAKGNVVKGHDRLSYDVKITAVYDANDDKYPVDWKFNIADGRLLDGAFSAKAKQTGNGLTKDDVIADRVTGYIDFTTGLMSVSSCSGVVKKFDIGGYCSNENNERHVSLQYAREEKQFFIKDGFRMDVPYSVEQLEDAKALLDIDLYKKTYDNLSDIHTEVEDSNILKFLDDEFAKYDGVEVDVLDFTSFVKKPEFDCDHSAYDTVALRSEYIEKELKFMVDRAVIDLADTAKIENMTFVLYGNPRYISLLGDNVKWVVRSGDSLGGVKLNYSYGIMNSGDVKIQVVSACKIPEKIKQPNGDMVANNTLRIIPFPIDAELFTFKHYKYATHILTTANSGYRASDLPGGSMTNIMATVRCTTEAIQGIQAKMTIKNSDFVCA